MIRVSGFTANFTAIDFETANHRRDSACQLAAVKIRDGHIADSAMWMIRPKPFFFTRSNVRIHGITPGQVANESEFGDLWDEIAETFGDDCLVAHNAGFDIGVLLECLRRHRKEIPELEFTCTRVIARATWPGRGRYGLKPLADWLGVRFKHHDALEDSIACAKILLAAGIDKQASSLAELEKTLRLGRGGAGSWGYRGPSRSRRGAQSGRQTPVSRKGQRNLPPEQRDVVRESATPFDTASKEHSAPPTLDLQRLLIRADFIRPLSGKNVVFSGKLKSLSHDDAQRLACRAGGDCQSTVNGQTSFLVVGSAEMIGSADRSDEEQQLANRLKVEGRPIQILSEEEFLGLVVAQTPPEPGQ